VKGVFFLNEIFDLLTTKPNTGIYCILTYCKDIYVYLYCSLTFVLKYELPLFVVMLINMYDARDQVSCEDVQVFYVLYHTIFETKSKTEKINPSVSYDYVV